MRNKVNAVEDWLDTSNLKGFQKNLFEYHDDSLDEAAQMVGYDFELGFPKNYSSIGGRPAPLNPSQFPTLEEVDAIRHYYAPQILMEEGDGDLPSVAKSIIYPAVHEIEGLFAGDGWAQIKPDLYNNAISVLDEMAGEDKMPAIAFRNRLSNMGGGGMPKGEFGVFAEHALDRAMIPPSFTKVDIDLVKALNTIDIIARGQ